jgi:hypothetical protein
MPSCIRASVQPELFRSAQAAMTLRKKIDAGTPTF